jgi:hypothetical protein
LLISGLFLPSAAAKSQALYRYGLLGPDRIGAGVLGALKTLSADIEEGAMVTVDPRRVRVHLLSIVN